MRKQNTNNARQSHVTGTGIIKTGTLLSTFALCLAINTSVVAQSSPVTVDLSVLDDNNYNSANQFSAVTPSYDGTRSQGGLMMPSHNPPKSTYYGPALSNAALNAVKPLSEAYNANNTMSSTSLTTSDTVSAPEPEDLPEAPAVAKVQPVMEESISETVSLEPAPSAPPALPAAVTDAPPTSEAPTTSASETQELVEQETQTAALSPATQTIVSLEPGRAMQVIYAQANSEIPATSEAALNAVAAAIKANDNLRIQLMAFAGENGLSSSKARRLSLSRALSVRSFFIGQGVRSTRIDVRALGDKTDEVPLNRVDINITER